MSADVFTLSRGTTPLVLSLPHVGTLIPDPHRGHYVPRALAMEDTDWHLTRLYAFAAQMGASVIAATHSRYLIDLNRPPDDAPMYPGAANTELCPTKFFSGEPLYREGCEPAAAEIERRRVKYWWPYHLALRAELDRVRAKHGYVLHWDGHSIRSRIPWLFEGTLPDLNLGTASGASCSARIATGLIDILKQQTEFTYVLDGRFKGGYTTRYYGRPNEGFHTIQMEMAQSCYMDESPPFAYDELKAERVAKLLQALLRSAMLLTRAASERE
ncbi:MAG: N-formylglutamate deformylase [Burkholderiales bacterium]|nr:MAG: N-formylglutamate deformylase [Burkholderiales bacterium]TAG79942.1 MAG: N-formylglutamate deformylase [Betaproteobacteria bacterium]